MVTTVANETPKGRRTRARILAAAEALFAERGFHGTSVRDVAAAVGLKNASLLHYFPSKPKLYGAVLQAIADELDARLAAAIGDGVASPYTLRRFCESFLTWSEATPRRSNLLLRELLDNQSRVDKARRLHLQPLVEHVAAFIADGQARRCFLPCDPQLAVVHLLGALSYFNAATPTFARITGRTAAELREAYRRDAITWAERALLTGPTGVPLP